MENEETKQSEQIRDMNEEVSNLVYTNLDPSILEGKVMIEREVKLFAGGGYIYMPKTFRGKKVKILIDKEDIKDMSGKKLKRFMTGVHRLSLPASETTSMPKPDSPVSEISQ
jgi:putative transposon-encoded protein